MPGEQSDNFSMRVNPQDRSDWTEGAKLASAKMGLKVTVSDFLRIAAREKLEALRKEKKGGR